MSATSKQLIRLPSGAGCSIQRPSVNATTIVDMREGTIEIDDEVVYRDGAFRWEETFAA